MKTNIIVSPNKQRDFFPNYAEPSLTNTDQKAFSMKNNLSQILSQNQKEADLTAGVFSRKLLTGDGSGERFAVPPLQHQTCRHCILPKVPSLMTESSDPNQTLTALPKLHL